jgi:hypothetical protein
MVRVWADFNNRDEQGRVRLNTVGSLKDIEKHHDEIREGTKVILNAEDDFEVEARLTFDKVWRAIPDMTTIKYLNSEDAQE